MKSRYRKVEVLGNQIVAVTQLLSEAEECCSAAVVQAYVELLKVLNNELNTALTKPQTRHTKELAVVQKFLKQQGTNVFRKKDIPETIQTIANQRGWLRKATPADLKGRPFKNTRGIYVIELPDKEVQ